MDYPSEIGTVVEQVQGRMDQIGRRGVIVQVLGSIAGDTRVVVRSVDGTFEAYTRQLVAPR